MIVCLLLSVASACGDDEPPTGATNSGGNTGSGGTATTAGSGGSSQTGSGGSASGGQTGFGGSSGSGGQVISAGGAGGNGGRGGAGGAQDAAVDGRDTATDVVVDANRDTACPAVKCAVACPFGYVVDARGCQTCTCRPALPCRPSDCGGPPPVAAICPTGSARVTVCERNSAGVCSWYSACDPITTSCASPTIERCHLKPNCRWLAPGCGTPALMQAGCYATAELGCTPTSCPSGKTCVTRNVNPCAHLGAGQAPMMSSESPGPADPAGFPLVPPSGCAACGMPMTICQ
ncbi:MAG TPA: hypothetical protein VGG33_12215 [Polyangia bacterium]